MTTVEPGILCARCDGVIYPLDGVRLDEGWVHANPIHCYHFAQDRALLAAHQLGEVREGLADARATAAAERRRVLALEKRVAELEALNANWREALRVTNDALKSVHSDLMEMARWRPVTEKPTVTAQYQVVLQYGDRRPMADHMAYRPESGWAGTGVIFWRPIPPLPPAPAPQEPTP